MASVDIRFSGSLLIRVLAIVLQKIRVCDAFVQFRILIRYRMNEVRSCLLVNLIFYSVVFDAEESICVKV